MYQCYYAVTSRNKLRLDPGSPEDLHQMVTEESISFFASSRLIAMIKSNIQSIKKKTKKKQKHMGLQGEKLKSAFPHHLAQKRFLKASILAWVVFFFSFILEIINKQKCTAATSKVTFFFFKKILARKDTFRKKYVHVADARSSRYLVCSQKYRHGGTLDSLLPSSSRDHAPITRPSCGTGAPDLSLPSDLSPPRTGWVTGRSAS